MTNSGGVVFIDMQELRRALGISYHAKIRVVETNYLTGGINLVIESSIPFEVNGLTYEPVCVSDAEMPVILLGKPAA